MTKYTIYRPDGSSDDNTVDWPAAPKYDAIAALIRPLLMGANLEHVTVLHNGGRRDMFVDEMGAVKGLPRNEAATAIYRNNWLNHRHDADPESLPAIYGTAILFPHDIVWT